MAGVDNDGGNRPVVSFFLLLLLDGVDFIELS